MSIQLFAIWGYRFLLVGIISFVSVGGVASENDKNIIYILKSVNDENIIRVITTELSCPEMHWASKKIELMQIRNRPETIPARQSAQAQSKEAIFPVMTCESAWRAKEPFVEIMGKKLVRPIDEVRRIVVIGDTGCRVKASDNAFQGCNNEKEWPFKKIVHVAAGMNPDLIIHVGDFHYRESPCDATRAECASSSWGYGFDTWNDDFFKPAKELLEKAPWVFVRGNHESCYRAGQGWFRYLSPEAASEKRTCNLEKNDSFADYSTPYSVSLGKLAQLLVFDSSMVPSRLLRSDEKAYEIYTQQFIKVEQLAKLKPMNIFTSHHPVTAFAPVGNGVDVYDSNAGIRSVLQNLYQDRLAPDQVALNLHGHIHTFELLNFGSAAPITVITGNSGSATDKPLPLTIPSNKKLFDRLEIKGFETYADFGFLMLERLDNSSQRWKLVEYSQDGSLVYQCVIDANKSGICHH